MSDNDRVPIGNRLQPGTDRDDRIDVRGILEHCNARDGAWSGTWCCRDDSSNCSMRPRDMTSLDPSPMALKARRPSAPLTATRIRHAKLVVFQH